MANTTETQTATIFTELWARWVQLELGCTQHEPRPEQAAEVLRGLQAAHARRKAGTLDADAFRAWAIERVPWLAAQLSPAPAQQQRRAWSPPPARSVPAPTAAAAELARRIVRSGG